MINNVINCKYDKKVDITWQIHEGGRISIVKSDKDNLQVNNLF